MNILAKIFFTILIYLFVEIYVFVEVSMKIGFFFAAILLIFFSMVGYMIAKKIKSTSFQDALIDYSNGRPTGKNLIRSASFFVSGILFLMPGFVTDFIAIFFLIPFLNYYLIYIILKYLKNKFSGHFTYNTYQSHNENESYDVKDKTFTFISLPFNDKKKEK
ncbi:FxsA family protein [Candidatus Acidulodesulfobacterium sp. H_13]|uniref:FxsA family protein n=1 Tax=Candidatus Acidulodesulfobacterium sp. H_13 TaxID=3395470 RepID=UPI003AF5102B